MTSQIFIVTCGDHKPDAVGVHKGMRPECEVIYAGFGVAETLKELPRLLTQQPLDPATLHTQVASNSFSTPPAAIIIGGGYDDNDFRKLDDAIVEAYKDSPLPISFAYFRADNQLTNRLFAEGKGPQKRTEDYPAAITRRLKDRLQGVLEPQGITEATARKIFWY